MPAKISLLVLVQGQEAVDKLAQQLANIKEWNEKIRLVKEKVSLMYEKETELMKRQNMISKATSELSDDVINNRAVEMNQAEDNIALYEKRMTVERKALRIQEEASALGQSITIADARLQAQTTMAFEADELKKQVALRQTRRALMQASISLFVLNISANQMISALKPLVKGNEEYTKTLDQMSATLNLTLGPMQLMMSLQQISINLTNQQAIAVKGLLASMGALFFIYTMITTKSKELKILMGALAGIFTVLAIRQMMSAKATWIQAGGIATLRALAMDFSGLATLLVGGAITGALVGAMVAYSGFQTLPGRKRKVSSSQMGYLHSGEEVSRPVLADRAKSGGDTYHLHFDRGTSRSDASYIAQTVREAINTGSIRRINRGISTGG